MLPVLTGRCRARMRPPGAIFQSLSRDAACSDPMDSWPQGTAGNADFNPSVGMLPVLTPRARCQLHPVRHFNPSVGMLPVLTPGIHRLAALRFRDFNPSVGMLPVLTCSSKERSVIVWSFQSLSRDAACSDVGQRHHARGVGILFQSLSRDAACSDACRHQ